MNIPWDTLWDIPSIFMYLYIYTYIHKYVSNRAQAGPRPNWARARAKFAGPGPGPGTQIWPGPGPIWPRAGPGYVRIYVPIYPYPIKPTLGGERHLGIPPLLHYPPNVGIGPFSSRICFSIRSVRFVRPPTAARPAAGRRKKTKKSGFRVP